MNFRRNYSYDLDYGVRYGRPKAGLVLTLCLGLCLGAVASWWIIPRPWPTSTPNHPQYTIERFLLRPLMSRFKSAPTASQTTNLKTATKHRDVTTTVFWVGETSSAENAYISNAASYWDGQWQQHFGGVDTPTSRQGYRPAAFVPAQNPFYIALPYGDVTTTGGRKPKSSACKALALDAAASVSWCKNSWVRISHNGHEVYAQWEDVGPNDEDDADYVFGNAAPRNTFGAHAGLDVSPAVRDYLGLADVDTTSWEFVLPTQVPDGPWRQTPTTAAFYF